MFKNAKAFSSFSVDNLAKAKEFYEVTLGLNLTETPEGTHLNLAGGGEVFIYEKPNHTAATFTILNFIVENIDTAVDELTGKGIAFEHYTGDMQTDEKGIMRGGGPLIAWFKDPAGNFISIIEQK